MVSITLIGMFVIDVFLILLTTKGHYITMREILKDLEWIILVLLLLK